MYDLKAFQKHYATIDDEELRFIAAKSQLTEAATSALQEELKRRGITDVAEYKQQLDEENTARREYLSGKLAAKLQALRKWAIFSYLACMVLFLAGAARYFIEGNERDGVGIMIASAITLPIFWVMFFVRRRVWQFMLRHNDV